VITPGFLDHAFSFEEIGALDCAFFIGGFENEAISEIQREDAGFLTTKRSRQPLRATDSRVA